MNTTLELDDFIFTKTPAHLLKKVLMEEDIFVVVCAKVSKSYPATLLTPAEGNEIEEMSIKHDNTELYNYLTDTAIERLEREYMDSLNIEPDEE